MTLFIEVEPPVATVPDRLLRSLAASEAEEATEEAVEEAEEAVELEAAVELEELPPQAARAPAAAAAPQTARKERRLIFFIGIFLQITGPGLVSPGISFSLSLCVFLSERPHCTTETRPLRPWQGKIHVKFCAPICPK